MAVFAAMMRSGSIPLMVVSASLWLVSIAPPAQAQQRRSGAGPPRWEIDVHVGGANSSLPSNGTPTAVPPSSSFLTFANLPSLRIPSWYFGDGSQLFNSFPSGVRLGNTITPLDPAMAVAAGGRSGVVAGGRLARALTGRLSAEFTFDYSTRISALPGIAQSAAEESRTSFERAFNAFFTSPGNPWLQPSVTSTVETGDAGHGQVVALGALLLRLRPGRMTPFVTIGGGVASTVGDAPRVSLTGRYEMQFQTLGTFREIDVVSLTYELSRNVPVVALGGGFTYEASSRTGLRVDLRALVGRTTATTRLTANPGIEQRLPPFVVALHPSTGTGNGVQFSNNTVISGRESSLSSRGDWETFRASGTVSQIGATAGWYWRF
jgi:hypothetical protein